MMGFQGRSEIVLSRQMMNYIYEMKETLLIYMFGLGMCLSTTC